MDSTTITNKLSQKFGLTNLPNQERDKILAQLAEAVFERLLVETLKSLNKDDLTKYKQLIDNNVSPEELEDFLQKAIPDYDSLTQKVIGDVATIFKAN